MAQAQKQDIDLGIVRLEYGDAARPQRATLQIETSKYYNGGLISDAGVYWVGATCRQQLISMGGDDGDWQKRMIVNRTAKATQKNIDTQHAQAFTPEVIAQLAEYAKLHYARVIRAGKDGYGNVYQSQEVAA